MHSVSIIIPVFNEVENVAELHREINEVCIKNGYDYEIIFIDDGSTDGTFKALKALQPVKIIRFRKNFGQTAAFDAGIKAATKEFVVTMDGDGQNDPNEIPQLFETLLAGDFDVVSGWRKHRKDTFMKRFISRGANFLRKILIHDGINDSGCSLKLYKRECFTEVTLYGEMHRFIPALLKIKGYIIGECVVNHRSRKAGKTKYKFNRTLKGFIDMIAVWFWNKYSVRPLHLLGGMGLFFIALGGFSGLITVYKFFQGEGMSESAWPMLTMFFFLSGVQMFISGLIADILLKNYYDRRQEAYYVIRETIENQG